MLSHNDGPRSFRANPTNSGALWATVVVAKALKTKSVNTLSFTASPPSNNFVGV